MLGHTSGHPFVPFHQPDLFPFGIIQTFWVLRGFNNGSQLHLTDTESHLQRFSYFGSVHDRGFISSQRKCCCDGPFLGHSKAAQGRAQQVVGWGVIPARALQHLLQLPSPGIVGLAFLGCRRRAG